MNRARYVCRTKRRLRLRAASLAGSAISLALAVPAHAQEDGGAAAEKPAQGEIVVTATKRGAQRAIDVPIPIQSISGDSLAQSGSAELADYAAKVPSLQLQDLGPGDKKYVIRGITSTGSATVGVYYDEAIITASNANDGGGRNADIRLYDLERVEVLKGPQGTLYGAGSMSGTIRYVTKKPDLAKVEGYAAGEYSHTEGGGSNYLVNGAVNLPVVEDKLGIRAVGWMVDNSGYVDQIRIPAGRIENVNNDYALGGRLSVRLAPSDRVTLTASATIQTVRSNGSSRYTPQGSLSFGDTAAGYPPVAGGDLLNTDLVRSPWNEKLQVYSLVGEFDLGSGSITATTNLFKRRIDYAFDSSPILFFFGVPVPAVTLQPQRRQIWSNELRYASKFDGPINLLAGAYYEEEQADFIVEVVRTNDLGLPRGPFSRLNADDALIHPVTGNTFFGRRDDRRNKRYAFFGEVSAEVLPKFTLTAGARYFHEDLSAEQETTHPFGGFGPSPEGIKTNQASFGKVTFKFNASYRPNSDLNIYATASQGFRSGGVNQANLPFASGIPEGFGPDLLWNYEVGVKARLLDGLLYLDTSAFVIDWSNIQVRTVDLTGSFPYIDNAGSARVKGLEALLTARPAKGLELTLGGSYQDAKLTSDQPDQTNINSGRRGDRLPNVPTFQGSIGLDYRTPVAAGLDLTFGADLSYRGPTETQFSARSPFNVRLDSYSLVNARIGLTNDKWTLTAFIRNAFNKRAQVDAIASDQDPLARITVRPRTIGLSLTGKF